MQAFDNSFNNTKVDRNVNILYQIQDISNLQIRFGLEKSRSANIVLFNIIDVLDIFFNNPKIEKNCNFVSGNNDTMMMDSDKVS